MIKDDILRMAREAKLPDPMVFYASIERFAALFAAAEQKKWQDQTVVEIHEAVLDEREACAQLCDIRETMFKGYKTDGLAALCAAAIRARGNHEPALRHD